MLTSWLYASFVMHLCLYSIKCIIYDALSSRLEGSPMHLSTIGPLLQEARKKSRLSQAQLAAALGMSRATISAIEGGRCEEIGFTKLSSLLDMVGLDLTVIPRVTRPTIDHLRAERRNK